MKILLCHVFVPVLPGNTGGPEPACQVAPLAHPYEWFTWAFPHVPFPRQPPTRRHCVVSHIELVISDSEHALAPFPHIMYNKNISLELY